MVVNDVFQEWYQLHVCIIMLIEYCTPLIKATQGHPGMGNWWSTYSNHICAKPLALQPDLTEPMLCLREEKL
jgi:hypothetical protein